MLRLLLLIFAAFASSSLLAAEAPSLFTPVEGDKSLIYLGAIFGNQLVAGGTDMQLFSHVFEVFNAGCLTIGVTICIYTIIVGTLHTAAQGKPLGEKWNGVWIPLRTVMGISLLVPKAGTGYCMAQYCVMWLVIQGVGLADSIWSKSLDYFIAGGAIYSNSQEKAGSYMNKGNLDNTFSLEQFILVNTACVAAHNAGPDAKLFGKYEIYSTDDDLQINFGNPDLWGGASSSADAGFECGSIAMPLIDNTLPNYDLILATYNNAFEAMAIGLADIGEFLASEEGSDEDQWSVHLPVIQSIAVTFINQLAGASAILFPSDTAHGGKYRENLEDLKKYGWIMAGNYYMTLSHFQDELTTIKIIIPNTVITDPSLNSEEKYATAILNAKEFWGDPDFVMSTPERYAKTFDGWPAEYKYDTIPGYTDEWSEDAIENKNYGVNKNDLEDIKNHLRQLGALGGAVDATGSGKTASMSPIYYMDQITGVEGENGGVRDPILRAAKFGKKLTDTAVAMIMIYFGLALIFVISYVTGWVPCTAANNIVIPLLLIVVFTTPIIFGIASFLYAQGVLLGVVLPLIPFVTFFVGVTGWYMAVVESVVAAPLVAIGLIFPETQQEVWGRAEPAYMMILNLFLRPSLMIIGFLAAMVLTWVSVDLLNAAFYLFVVDGAHIENVLFGYIVITMAYIGTLIAVVSKVYELINDLPNKTLMWIGDKSMQQEGAREMLGAAKGGAEKGGQAAAGAMGTAGKLAGKGVGMAQQKVQGEADELKKNQAAALAAANAKKEEENK